ncbi:hypothetical protein M427DRAFT_217149 [Gonapodya prolifera JEL478]|uniref:BZIP domain-containing protein n=1 Tax=Gonapodya prolifera (strain JEL478) TaxID=1344416 RepID=A0A138ZYR8_GONPJ|nr:hypothetical protein M427DRAFT_217149 [Gonapodya prolifera JEL478]|eukprot:KXS09654.1 hypothetical protein M427DRAFT_217149 [Gonapodya prolifera JEL478]
MATAQLPQTLGNQNGDGWIESQRHLHVPTILLEPVNFAPAHSPEFPLARSPFPTGGPFSQWNDTQLMEFPFGSQQRPILGESTDLFISRPVTRYRPVVQEAISQIDQAGNPTPLYTNTFEPHFPLSIGVSHHSLTGPPFKVEPVFSPFELPPPTYSPFREPDQQACEIELGARASTSMIPDHVDLAFISPPIVPTTPQSTITSGSRATPFSPPTSPRSTSTPSEPSPRRISSRLQSSSRREYTISMSLPTAHNATPPNVPTKRPSDRAWKYRPKEPSEDEKVKRRARNLLAARRSRDRKNRALTEGLLRIEELTEELDSLQRESQELDGALDEARALAATV